MSIQRYKTPRPKNGFTLIELVIYIGLISVFITGMIYFALDIVLGREKVFQKHVVNQSARIALAKITYEIHRAKNIQSITSNEIVLDNGGSATTITLLNGVVQITSAGQGPYHLTSNQVRVLAPPDVPDPLFTNLITSNNNSKNVGIHLSVRQANSSVESTFQAQTTIIDAVELPGQFNEARSLLMNAASALLSQNGRRLTNTTLQNFATNTITIDKMRVSWTGVPSSRRMNEIVINGSSVWSGSVASSTIVDITNVILPNSVSPIPIDRIVFNGSMVGAIITVEYIMADGSTMKTEVDF